MRLRVLCAAVGAALLSVPAAGAGLLDPVTQLVLPTCGATSYPFKSVDDDRSAYYAFQNNGFESGSYGWSLSGAYVGSGNEPWYANGSGSRSLVLPAGASATSPGFCINLLDPAIRMFARGPKGGTLNVQVLFRGLTGNLTGVLNHSAYAGTGAWMAGSKVNSALALPLGTAYAQIRVTSASGTWNVDDLFVDPYEIRLG